MPAAGRQLRQQRSQRLSQFSRRLLVYAAAAGACYLLAVLANISRLPASVIDDMRLLERHEAASQADARGHAASLAGSGHSGHAGMPRFRVANESKLRVRVTELLAPLLLTNATQPAAGWRVLAESGQAAAMLADKVAKAGRSGRLFDPEDEPLLCSLRHLLRSAPIIQIDAFTAGSQLKLVIMLQGNVSAVFKPRAYDRDRVITGGAVAGRDRDNAEVASQALARLLLTRRGPPAVSRSLKSQELLLKSTKRLRATFFNRRGSDELCLFGLCRYCTGWRSGVCAADGVLEGAAILLVPQAHSQLRHPWSRSYSPGVLANWQTGDNICTQSLVDRLGWRLLLDMIDTSAIDFLMGNADRHDVQVATAPLPYQLLIDNGKGLGNHLVDQLDVLAPLRQCCRMRAATFARLVSLQGLLQPALDAILYDDVRQLSSGPLLTKRHAVAMERRLRRVVHEVARCVRRRGRETVLVRIQDS